MVEYVCRGQNYFFFLKNMLIVISSGHNNGDEGSLSFVRFKITIDLVESDTQIWLHQKTRTLRP
jgi:hypothetical protein